MKTHKLALVCGVAIVAVGCDASATTPVSDTGVKKITSKIEVGQDGMTNEQRNIDARYKQENAASIKHLYVISPYSGDVLLYSTVKGKVTSGGKRLTPKTIHAADPNQAPRYGIPINIGGQTQLTGEVLQDDGTYGDSCEYVYWFDQRSQYHQHFFTGGQIIHVSSQPIRVGKVVLNLEMLDEKDK